MKKCLQIIVFFLATGLASGVTAADKGGEVFQPLSDTTASVNATLDAARQANKRALIVMGANWCHDSRALASQFQSPKIAEQIARDFELLFVDVAYLNSNFDVNQRFGLPVIFGTPTLLAIDPESQQLLNRDNLYIWANAANMKSEEIIEQLAALPPHPVAESTDNPALLAAMEKLDQFERAQAKRIYAGFAVVGPMLAAYKKGETPEHFDHYWNQLRDMRAQLPRDLERLRREVREKAAQGEKDIQLELPVYAAFDWEKTKQE